MGEQFAVLMFFEDGNRRYVRRFISAQEASRTFEHCIHSVEARSGIPMRVVITDRYDCILREWQFGKGITFPPENFPKGPRLALPVSCFSRARSGSGWLQVTAAAPSQDARMPDLSLKKSGRRRDDAYDVIADGAVVGRIMLFTANPTELPWVWTIAPGYEEGRSTTHGYAKTLEAATQAFARSWFGAD
jgi:hypothetical protein